jgi:hypothetical protein
VFSFEHLAVRLISRQLFADGMTIAFSGKWR